MTLPRASEVFDLFMKLDGDTEKELFLSRLMMWSDLHLPDNKFMVLTKDQYRRATQGFAPENPALYEVAKEVCLSLGFPYHHPLTGEVTNPPEAKHGARNSRKARKVRKPRDRRR